MNKKNGWLKDFINKMSVKEKEKFKFGNKILMALTHLTVSKMKANGNPGITKDEVIETLNKFSIDDKFYDAGKSTFTDDDALDISMMVFELSMANYVTINPEDLSHIYLTPLGFTMGLQSFNVVKPMKITAVYEVYNDIASAIEQESDFSNN